MTVMTDDAIMLTDTLERLPDLARALWARAGSYHRDITEPDEGDLTIPLDVRIQMRRVAEAIDLRIAAWVKEAESLQAQAQELVV